MKSMQKYLRSNHQYLKINSYRHFFLLIMKLQLEKQQTVSVVHVIIAQLLLHIDTPESAPESKGQASSIGFSNYNHYTLSDSNRAC